jgi:hypothetical protein
MAMLNSVVTVMLKTAAGSEWFPNNVADISRGAVVPTAVRALAVPVAR